MAGGKGDAGTNVQGPTGVKGFAGTFLRVMCFIHHCKKKIHTLGFDLCVVYPVCLQVLQVSPSWESQVPKEKMVSQALQGSPDLLDSRARLDHRVCVTAVEAATEFPSKQVSYQERSTNSSDTQPANIKI